MKNDELKLLRRAKAGDEEARKELGLGLLHGNNEFRRIEAISYLRPLLPDTEVAEAVVSALPLSELVRLDLLWLCQQVASRGNETAAQKYGLWLHIIGKSESATEWLIKAGIPRATSTAPARLLSTSSNAIAGDTARLLADRLAVESPLPRPSLLALALAVDSANTVTQDRLLELLRHVEMVGGETSPIRPEDVHTALKSMAERGIPQAYRLLGCALAERDVGLLRHVAITPKRNSREGYAYLLRAAHAGAAEAWFDLFVLSSNYRSVLANQGAAQFFLERAAESGIIEAMRIRGARVLLNAVGVSQFAFGQRWLMAAAEAGDSQALDVLTTFYLPIAVDAQAKKISASLANAESEVALLLRLAAEFQLTRDEAVKMDLSNAVVDQSLVVLRHGDGFALPALDRQKRDLLRQVQRSAATFPSGPGFTKRRAAAIRALIHALDLEERGCFLDSKRAILRTQTISGWKRVHRAMVQRIAAPPSRAE